MRHVSEGKRFLIVGFVWDGDMSENVADITLLSKLNS
jgi:hypothetical protein